MSPLLVFTGRLGITTKAGTGTGETYTLTPQKGSGGDHAKPVKSRVWAGVNPDRYYRTSPGRIAFRLYDPRKYSHYDLRGIHREGVIAPKV